MTNYLTAYQSFKTVQEMDIHVQKHIMEHNGELNETDRVAVTLLARYACKFPGAAHLKVESICKAIDKSEATVRRTLRKLEKLAIIKKVPTIRKVSKGYGANIIVILPFDDHSSLTARGEDAKLEIPRDEPIISQKETDIFLISKKELFHNTYSDDKVRSENSVDNFSEKKEPTFYQQFKSAIFATSGQDQQLVSRLYGVYRSLTYHSVQLFPQEQRFYENAGYQALTISLHAMKKKKVRNLPGYFVGVFEKICERALFEFYLEHEE